MIVMNQRFLEIALLFYNAVSVVCSPFVYMLICYQSPSHRLTNFILLYFVTLFCSVEDGDAVDPCILSTLRKLQDGYFAGARSVSTCA